MVRPWWPIVPYPPSQGLVSQWQINTQNSPGFPGWNQPNICLGPLRVGKKTGRWQKVLLICDRYLWLSTWRHTWQNPISTHCSHLAGFISRVSAAFTQRERCSPGAREKRMICHKTVRISELLWTTSTLGILRLNYTMAQSIFRNRHL